MSAKSAKDLSLAGSVITVGTFDGIHVGHQALVARCVARARALELPAIAYTFDPHPAQILAPAKAPVLLSSIEERIRVFRSLGIDRVVTELFDRAFADVTADAWIEQYIVAPLAPRAVIVGFNFSYGKARGGDPAHLQAAGKRLGFDVEVVGPVELDGEVVSSTRIRRLLAEGDVTRAARLLGRPFALTGKVVEGDRRGRTLGFPTANLAPDLEIMPSNGVYAAWAVLPGEARVPAVVNVGRRPTFGGGEVRAEAFLIDFSCDIYGQRLRLELIGRVRDERRFDGLDALKAQIARDVESARDLLK